MLMAYYRSSADASAPADGVASMHARRPGWPDNPENDEHLLCQVARNRRGRMGGPVYSPMRSAITSICRPKNSSLASITLLNWPDSSKLTVPNS
jgi:hypothetical protein